MGARALDERAKIDLNLCCSYRRLGLGQKVERLLEFARRPVISVASFALRAITCSCRPVLLSKAVCATSRSRQ